MHVGIDARFFGPSSSGLGRYTAELIDNLLALDANVRLTLFLRPEGYHVYANHPQVTRVLFPYRWYTLTEQLRFPPVLRRAQADVLHFPHFNVSVFSPQPFVVTVHDLILHDFPTERASTLSRTQYWLKRKAYHVVIRRAIERAARIITISEYSKQNLLRHFPISPRRVTVTYEGASDIASPASEQADQAVVAKYHLQPGYVLYVGNAYPHKNLEMLLRAWVRVRAANPRLVLVVAGKDDYFRQRLQAFAASLDLEPGREVVFPGFVPDADLGAFYRGAGLYVFPSLSEGFGLPGLEAMRCGLPVASSRSSCLPEVFGDAAVYFDPKRPDDMARVIVETLASPRQLAELRARGFVQVKKYSWRRLASETLAVYRSVVEVTNGTR